MADMIVSEKTWENIKDARKKGNHLRWLMNCVHRYIEEDDLLKAGINLRILNDEIDKLNEELDRLFNEAKAREAPAKREE